MCAALQIKLIGRGKPLPPQPPPAAAHPLAAGRWPLLPPLHGCMISRGDEHTAADANCNTTADVQHEQVETAVSGAK